HHSFFPFLHLLQAECVFCIGKMGVKKLIVKIYPVHKLALLIWGACGRWIFCFLEGTTALIWVNFNDYSYYSDYRP
ncbi:MAG: hypothetical protein IJU53_07515, partial [Thermoguttaceae bacterium]|nr:hypothetical protein [Thermoguttaceae bacterium]